MKKLIPFALAVTLSTSLVAMTDIDKKVIDFQKDRFEKHPAYDVNSIKLASKQALDKTKWAAYKFDLDLTQKSNNKRIQAPMIVYSNGRYITDNMIDMSTGQKVGEKELQAEQNKKRESMEKSFVLSKDFYNKKHLIAGNHNAKTKLVVFSDPLCVFCIKNVPGIIKSIKGRDDIALYYYDFPLDMHPTAKTVVKAIHKAKEDGYKDVELKIYEANYEKFYNVYTTKDNKKALEVFNKIMGTNYTMNQIDTAKAKERVENDIFLGMEANVQGTPSVLFNGSYYKSREKLKKFLSK
jgi:predicted DsbA family dithiol-disulfide isomerase